MRMFLLTLTMGIFGAGASAPDWELVSRSEEVTLFKKEIPGSPVLAYKATAKLNAPLAKVLSVVKDTPRLPEWTYRVKEAEILEEVPPTDRIIYLHVGAPWPVKDRDAVYRNRLIYDKSKSKISLCMESVEDVRRKESPSRIRAHVFPSCFFFTTPDRGKTTEIEAELHGDPRGSIPKWIVNMIQKIAPVKTLRNLKRRVESPGIVDDPQTLDFLK
jgi:hypothetical protein